MEPADYRLVRSSITEGIMKPIKHTVLPKTTANYFSSWLYGQRKSTKQICVSLPRSSPCLVCSVEQKQPKEEFSLLTVDDNVFLQSLPVFNNEQLSILYSLLDDDRQSYRHAIEQQYRQYKQMLIQSLEVKQIESSRENFHFK